jgi:hypothetical protein
MTAPMGEGRGLGRAAAGRIARVVVGSLIILASVAAAAYFYLEKATLMQRERIRALERIEARLTSGTLPLRFMVLSREDGTIRARIRLYDLDGKEVGLVEGSWPGEELCLDFLLVPLGRAVNGGKADSGEGDAARRWLSFPYRVFTDRVAPASGRLLFDVYDSSGFPAIFRGGDLGAEAGSLISSYFAKARKAAAEGLPAAGEVEGSFGSAVHETASIAAFRIGTIYRVLCRDKGGIEILEE